MEERCEAMRQGTKPTEAERDARLEVEASLKARMKAAKLARQARRGGVPRRDGSAEERVATKKKYILLLLLPLL